MRKKYAIVAVGLIVLLAGAAPAYAHGGLHEQIAAATEEIKRAPANGALYLKRGELHRLHRNWAAALRDYRLAHALDRNLHLVHLSLGRMFLEAGKPRKALQYLNRFLARNPEDAEALVACARAYRRLGRNRPAADCYSAAIDRLPSPKPDYYLERARALAAEGRRYHAEALAGIDEGIGRLGPVISLQLLAIELELKSRNYDRALVRLDLAASQAARKEQWLVRRGEALRRAGREREAREALKAAIEAIELLPAHLRGTRAMIELENLARSMLR